MEQMEMSIKTEAEAAATSPAHCDSEIGVNFFEQDPRLLQSVKSEPTFTNDALLKEEILLDSSPDGSEKQCVHAASTPASAGGGVNETCNTDLGDVLNVKYESADMDIGPTVLQHMDTHYPIYKNTSAAAKKNTVMVDCNEAMPGGGGKKNIEGEWRDGREQQCVHDTSTSACTGGVNEICSPILFDLLNVRNKSAEMDIGPTVLQHMDSHYTYNKNMSTATEENEVVVDCNEAIPGGGGKRNIEGEWRDGSEQQCVDVASTSASTGGVNNFWSMRLVDLLNKSAVMDIRPTVHQRMDSHYTSHKNMSAATEVNAVMDDCNEAMPGGGVKKNIEGGFEQQCVYAASISAHAGGVNETCSTILGDLLNVKYESVEMDIGPTVLQHMDTHYTIHKNTSAATETNAVVVDCNEAMPGGGGKDSVKDDKATSHTCNQTTTAVDYDWAHVYSHPGQQQEQQQAFAKNIYLSRHVRVHTGKKRYQCKICDASFSQNKNLLHHMRLHTGEKTHQCNICDARFATKRYLSRHMKVHMSDKPYQCKICDAKFVANRYLTVHMRRHTGVKRYQCKICNARFTENNNLTHHMRLHMDEKPYKCKICDERFATYGYINRHMRVHVGEKHC